MLLSRACFRFGSTKQNSLRRTTFTNCQNSRPHSHPLFFNSRGEKLTRAGVNHILIKYVDIARKTGEVHLPDKVSCHVLRHSRAMHLLQAGVNLVYTKYRYTDSGVGAEEDETKLWEKLANLKDGNGNTVYQSIKDAWNRRQLGLKRSEQTKKREEKGKPFKLRN